MSVAAENPVELLPLNTRRIGAKYCCVSERTLDQYIADGRLKVIKLGRLVRIPREELERFAREGFSA